MHRCEGERNGSGTAFMQPNIDHVEAGRWGSQGLSDGGYSWGRDVPKARVQTQRTIACLRAAAFRIKPWKHRPNRLTLRASQERVK